MTILTAALKNLSTYNKMHKALLLFLFAILYCVLDSNAQDEKLWLRQQADTLCSKHMAGRGYVNNGKENAMQYIEDKFAEFDLKPGNAGGSYLQSYYFPVNTFPGEISLRLGETNLIPGIDFLIDAGSASFSASHLPLESVDLSRIFSKEDWAVEQARWKTDKYIYLLKHTDSLCKRLSIKTWRMAADLPKGCFIIPEHGKLTWTVSTSQYASTVFYVEDTVIKTKIEEADVKVEALFLERSKNNNIVGIVPGQVKDSFIIFSAHYDHLGMMGNKAMFPGASDNASGTSMLLYLAKYFAAHPQHYSIAFISFSGEEAGLKGSEYFVQHPLIPLDHIKFLTNLDIMGDATDGVTVVNATEYPKQFEMLQQLNTKHNYLPAIKSRGKAANSDHYHFSEAGVPAFFIYSNGGKGFYHDVFDKAEALSLNNIDKLVALLIEFEKGLNK